jgi:hypothetical protein
MRMNRLLLFAGLVAIGVAGYLTGSRNYLNAQQPAAVKIKPGDIGGVVTSSKGPEAGVWVIAETTDLPTRYIKEVVTDDRGRYLIPDLPKAKYMVWARLWTGGFAEGASRTWKAGRPEAIARARRQNRGAALSRQLLVLNAQGSGEERISRHRSFGQRHLNQPQDSG